MPAEVYEDSIELQIGLFEAAFPKMRDAFGSSYPYPPLKALDRTEMRAFRAAVLENDFLKATFLPDMGGRLISLLDKRTDTQILPQKQPLRPVFDSVRHASIPDGLQVTLDGRDRHNAMGTVAYAAEPSVDHGPAGLWLAEVAGPVSWHAHWTLQPDSAELKLELRIFNRTLEAHPYDGGISIWSPGARLLELSEGVAIWFPESDCGLAIWEDETVLPSIRHLMGTTLVTRAQEGFQLAPRQLDTFRLTIHPYSGLGDPKDISRHGALGLAGGKLSLRSPSSVKSGKLVLLTQDGQTLEAPAEITPGTHFEADLATLPSPPTEFALINSDKDPLLRHSVGNGLKEIEQPPTRIASLEQELEFDPEATRRTLRAQTLQQSLKAPAHTALALHASRAGRYTEAADELEQALLYNGEDHLNWWLKAVLQRVGGPVVEEQPELLNAHYLAPLEPALRAESFLSQPLQGSKDPNPILKPLEDTPEAFIEVACLLLEAGLLQEANRWLDESLRHVDLAMLRYLQAHTLLLGSRMHTDAASHVQAAANLPWGPPFPWRAAEKRALHALVETFPTDTRLREYAALTTA